MTGIVINNGVKIKEEFVFPSRPITFLQDIIFALRSRFKKYSINGNFEAGVYLSHLRVTKPNDKVLAVGLGNGSTLIPVVKLMNHSSILESYKNTATVRSPYGSPSLTVVEIFIPCIKISLF